MHRVVQLPTGPKAGWELDTPSAEAGDLKSVPESLVVLQSLRQSRSRWASTMFPKFSVKTRGGRTAGVVPPPHTTKAHGKYDLHVGPHVFSDTAIYEVHYLPTPADQEADGMRSSLPSSSTQHTSSSNVQTSLASIPFPSGTYVTPALSSKVAIAAESDPTLANLLSAVIKRTASEDQVKTLGFLIQSLESVPPFGPNSASVDQSPVQSPHRATSPKPFDIVLEFHERPSDRFILPRGTVVCELAPSKSGSAYRASDMIITCCLPFLGTASTDEETDPVVSPEVVSFRLSRVSQALWDLMVTWAGGPQKIEENRSTLAEIARQASPRTYLQHRLPEGELLTEIQTAVASPYTMKPVKPAGADSQRAKRKSVSRRPTTAVAPPSLPVENAVSPVIVKRRSQLKSKASAPPPIACHACGQTDVPLMMGGRYCRECISAGKAIAEIPQVQPNRTYASRPSAFPSTPSEDGGIEGTAFTSPTAASGTGTTASTVASHPPPNA
ncbi:hypothetical protein BV20DRAFT_1110334 [Pilatotrama ljubarskyi]|nr:hypothetical protein BV20DRAFT_1110334 [Pilatotrama ljubarskyi]